MKPSTESAERRPTSEARLGELPRRAVLQVAVDAPQHAALAPLLSYLCDTAEPPGRLLRVPLGRRETVGIVWHAEGDAPLEREASEAQDPKLRPVSAVFNAIAPLPAPWLKLVEFTAAYYQRSLGEVGMATLPPMLKQLDAAKLAAFDARWRSRRWAGRAGCASQQGGAAALAAEAEAELGDAQPAAQPPALHPEQTAALAALSAAMAAPEPPPCHLLFGATGSGKTEVYLQAAALAMAQGKQALILVPEINLTPQLLARFVARFGAERLALMHSGLTAAQRLAHWLAALHGEASVVLGTRLAVFAPLARLGLIVVDEEHDASYKQQDGARYSARDLAVYRGRLEGAAVVLGSATPSLESWQHAQSGRYRLLRMPTRVGDGRLPEVTIADTRAPTAKPPAGGPGAGPAFALLPAVVQAVQQRLDRQEQSLLFLNRRGYAPVLACGACGWRSACAHCSAWRVFHRSDRTLRCHHCGASDKVPRQCPQCGNADIEPVGRGTERLEEAVAAQWPLARIARIDADSMRKQGALEAELARINAGEVDIIVGTQMVTKGHDFRRITLVAALDADAALFSADFRASERLFAALLQAAGRAGRDAALADSAQMWVQTSLPAHPLFAALRASDYPAFAAALLQEREAAGMPPFVHLALLRGEAKSAADVEAFMAHARGQALALAQASAAQGEPRVSVYGAVPPAVQRVAGMERRQLLLESASRRALQRLLAQWRVQLLSERHPVARWAIDVDPLNI